MERNHPDRETVATALDRGGPVWLLEVQMQGEDSEGLVDTGASGSFVEPRLLANLKRPTEEMDVGL